MKFYQKLTTVCALGLTSINAIAQNPLVRNQFTADPTARVFNNRVFVYPSHDIISPVEPERKWFCMADYHMFSSSDLCEWNDHGVILSQEQVPWGNPTGYSMWAPDCVEKDGKYYFFFPNAPKDGRGFGVGVAIAQHPYGPYVPQEKNIFGINGIDPCVLQASDGNNYIFWGGGGLRVAKLKDNLLELADEEIQNPTVIKSPRGEMKMYGHAIEGLPEGFTEGPFAFELNGKYYLTYPWVRKKKGDPDGKGGTIDNPTECLAYAMSDKPMGPYEFKGVIMDEHENGCWTNHHSIVKYNGQWYLFYHNNAYSPSFDKNRSICCDSLTFNADGTIQKVIPTLRGVGITDARKPVQIDRYSAIGGGAHIEFHDTLNTFQGWKTIFPGNGAWVSYNKIELKDGGATNVCVKIKSTAKSNLLLELSGKTKINLPMPSTEGKWLEVNVPIKQVVAGVYDLKLTLKSKGEVEVDWVTLADHPKEQYFTPATDAAMSPDEDGFIRRWMLLDPIDKPNRSNAVFTDTYLRTEFAKEYFPTQHSTTMPKDGETVKVGNQSLQWHALESNRFNVKLLRFAESFEKQIYGVLFWGVTIIDCPEEIKDVRLAVGSNSASMWWLNGEEVVLLSGDRRMVKDDCISPRVTLKKGRNILRGTVINGPGMSDFCVRFINEKGEPVKNYNIILK